jgi:hypothetical protein
LLTYSYIVYIKRRQIISNSIKGTFIAVLHFSQIRFFYPIFKFYRGKKRSLFVTNITEIPIKNIYNVKDNAAWRLVLVDWWMFSQKHGFFVINLQTNLASYITAGLLIKSYMLPTLKLMHVNERDNIQLYKRYFYCCSTFQSNKVLLPYI